MKFEDVKIEMKRLTEDIGQLSRQRSKLTKKIIFLAAENIFETWPEIESIGWEQDSYYNDETYNDYSNTEPEEIFINDEQENEVEGGQQAADLLSDVLSLTSDEDLFSIFGHGQVTITKENPNDFTLEPTDNY